MYLDDFDSLTSSPDYPTENLVYGKTLHSKILSLFDDYLRYMCEDRLFPEYLWLYSFLEWLGWRLGESHIGLPDNYEIGDALYMDGENHHVN